MLTDFALCVKPKVYLRLDALDFKRGVPSVKVLALAVICLANAEGGKILLGVDHRGRIHGCLAYDVPELLVGVC